MWRGCAAGYIADQWREWRQYGQNAGLDSNSDGGAGGRGRGGQVALALGGPQVFWTFQVGKDTMPFYQCF